MKGASMITDFAAMLATLGEAQQIASVAMDATAGDRAAEAQLTARLDARLG